MDGYSVVVTTEYGDETHWGFVGPDGKVAVLQHPNYDQRALTVETPGLIGEETFTCEVCRKAFRHAGSPAGRPDPKKVLEDSAAAGAKLDMPATQQALGIKLTFWQRNVLCDLLIADRRYSADDFAVADWAPLVGDGLAVLRAGKAVITEKGKQTIAAHLCHRRTMMDSLYMEWRSWRSSKQRRIKL